MWQWCKIKYFKFRNHDKVAIVSFMAIPRTPPQNNLLKEFEDDLYSRNYHSQIGKIGENKFFFVGIKT